MDSVWSDPPWPPEEHAGGSAKTPLGAVGYATTTAAREAMRALEARLLETGGRGDMRGEFELLIELGFACRDACETRLAARRFREARGLALRMRDRVAEATALFGLGDAAFVRGRWKAAATYHRRAASMFSDAEEWGSSANAVYSLLLSLAALNRPSEAEQEARRLVELAERLDERHLVPFQLAQCTRLWLQQGNVKEALDYAVQSIYLAAHWRETGWPRQDSVLAVVAALEAGARYWSDIGAEQFWTQVYARIERDYPVAWPFIRRSVDRCRELVAQHFDNSTEATA